MKLKLLIASSLLMIFCSVRGQAVMDAYKLAETELTGTARFMSMGGAFGALGGDVSAIAVNPAGIGVYKSSEVVGTLNFQNVEATTMRMGMDMKNNKFQVNFNNLAFVGTFPLYSDVAPLLNVGFSYNRLNSFDRKYGTSVGASSSSMSEYMAWKTGNLDLGTLQNAKWGSGVDWLSIIGYDSYLITPNNKGGYKSTLLNQNGVNTPFRFENDLHVRERGSTNSYDFNIGTTFNDMLSVGMSLSVTDMDYRMNSVYAEDIYGRNGSGGFTIGNEQKTEGVGWDLGLGVIFKPIQELRIGIAYHSPTWYNMSNYSYAYSDDKLSGIINEMDLPADRRDTYKNGGDDTGDEWAKWDYKMRTPDRWVFSLAGVLGKNAILSLDYELVDYKKSKFSERALYADYSQTNGEIKDFYRLASTVRIGAEYRFTRQFSGRVGYSWQQSPYESEFKNNDYTVFTAGAASQYVVSGDKNYITWGLGYRFTRSFYTDIGFVYKTQKSDMYMYGGSDKIRLKENGFQGVITLGYRFNIDAGRDAYAFN